jgi:hypothetical protein
MISKDELMQLEMNATVKYSYFSRLTFKGKDDRHVHLEDISGDKKRVYIELFLKYGSIN